MPLQGWSVTLAQYRVPWRLSDASSPIVLTSLAQSPLPFAHPSQLLVVPSDVPSDVAAAPLCSAMHPCLKRLYKTQNRAQI